jgi:hypothetical protein
VSNSFACSGLTLSWVTFDSTGQCNVNSAPHKVAAPAAKVTAAPIPDATSAGQLAVRFAPVTATTVFYVSQRLQGSDCAAFCTWACTRAVPCSWVTASRVTLSCCHLQHRMHPVHLGGLTVLLALLLQTGNVPKVFCAWTNTDAAAVKFNVRVYKTPAPGNAPTVPVGSSPNLPTVAVRCMSATASESAPA